MVPSRIFRSRWAALLWAGGIIWTAYDVAMASRVSAPTHAKGTAVAQDATGEAIDPADIAILANVGGS